jgi:monoterpene epsilon-lactone hydrolase
MNLLFKILLSILFIIIFILVFFIVYILRKSKYYNIPKTISPEAQKILKFLYTIDLLPHKTPDPKDLNAWKKLSSTMEKIALKDYDKFIGQNKLRVNSIVMGGTPVLDIIPENWTETDKLIVYTHGGAFTQLSAKTSITNSGSMSRYTNLRIISIDYTLAPEADWKKIQEQILNVFKDLINQGYKMENIGFFGDSAGGGLAVSTVLNLRDAGLGMPACLILMSPWVDLTGNGDTYESLKRSEPVLDYPNSLKNSALAYANGIPLSDPHVSPLFGDFTKGFPPTLIIIGTKDIFLSTSAMLYRKLQQSGVDVKIDLNEGLWHVFTFFEMPETDLCFQICSDFFKKYLNF